MKYTKSVPMVLFSLFCLKALVTGLNLETVACIASLGVISFLYETFIQNVSIRQLETTCFELKKKNSDNEEYYKRELDQIKSFITSQKLNNIRGASGLNKTA